MTVLRIDPVTRIEGTARVTIALDGRGRVADARVHVLELRGFEAVLVGRPVEELPALTARICGICPVSHALAAARAGDLLLGADPPPAARALRELLQLAQLVQSHALSFFHLSAPDLVFGHAGDPARRNLLGLLEARPQLARDGVALRRFGQEAIAEVAGRRIHAAFTVPGGVLRPLPAAARDRIRAGLPAALEAAGRTLAWWLEELPRHREEAAAFGDPGGLWLALVGPDGAHALAEGRLRVAGPDGAPLLDGLDPAAYGEVIGEELSGASWVRRPFYRPMGPEAGLYRVGPQARLHACAALGTPGGDRALRAFRALGRGAAGSPFHAHLARLVELVHALERLAALLEEPALLGAEVLAPPGARRAEAVGACEAPRGTLLHHYRVDAGGLVTWANLVVATGQNARALDHTVRQLAERWLDGPRLTPEAANRIEAGVRAYDPCLSCAAHAEGARPAALELRGPGGALLDAWPRPDGQ